MTDHAIWKFEVPIGDRFEITMPRLARILTLDVQNDAPCLWALVVPTNAKAPRRFLGVGTGHPITFDLGGAGYIGTAVLMGGSFVYHVFEDMREVVE